MKENISNKISGLCFKGGVCIKLFAVCFLLLAFGCKAKKQLVVKKPVVDTTTAAPPVEDTRLTKLRAIRASQTVFLLFRAKRVRYLISMAKATM